MGAQTCIIACGVFRTALEHLELEQKFSHLSTIFLPSNLHLRPQDLRRLLLDTIISASEKNDRILCLYGTCFPDIDDFCGHQGVQRVPGAHCFEMLLGSKQYQNIIHENPGTYFLERELILNFTEYCVDPLELHDTEMRRLYYKRYERLLYVRQPSDPDLLSMASKLADFLHLNLEMRDANYRQFGKILADLI